MKFAQSHFRMASPAGLRHAMLLGLGLVALLALGGCDPRGGIEVPEVDEKQYRLGQQYLRSQQNQIALEAFLKVVDKRDGDAPESHFEAGRIYLTHLKDPYSAIYHFRRYLQIRPNSPQAEMVNQMIATAMKESLKGLPGSAMNAEVDRLDLLDMLEKLKRENADLRIELERAGRVPTTPPTLAPTQSAGRPAQQQAQVQSTAQQSSPPRGSTSTAQDRPVAPTSQPQTQALEPVPLEDLPVQPPVLVETPPAQAPVVRQAPQRPGTATTGAVSGRTYTVQPRDNLYAISRKVYGTETRWREIYEANRDRMKNERDLKIGMQLLIP